MNRREAIRLGGAVAAAALAGALTPSTQRGEMFGLIGKMTAKTGSRDALLDILLGGTTAMPGCLSYVIAKDPSDADEIWITEVWDSKASHDASLSLPAVKEAIAKARPLIAGMGEGIITTPVGGHGLANTG